MKVSMKQASLTKKSDRLGILGLGRPFIQFQALILLFGAAIAYECYECQYKGKDPENLCLRPSEDSGKVSVKSIDSDLLRNDPCTQIES